MIPTPLRHLNWVSRLTTSRKLSYNAGRANWLLPVLFFGVYMSPIRINAEAEAHATGIGSTIVEVVVTRSGNTAKVCAIAAMWRTQPPVVILLVGLGGAILLANR